MFESRSLVEQSMLGTSAKPCSPSIVEARESAETGEELLERLDGLQEVLRLAAGLERQVSRSASSAGIDGSRPVVRLRGVLSS